MSCVRTTNFSKKHNLQHKIDAHGPPRSLSLSLSVRRAGGILGYNDIWLDAWWQLFLSFVFLKSTDNLIEKNAFPRESAFTVRKAQLLNILHPKSGRGPYFFCIFFFLTWKKKWVGGFLRKKTKKKNQCP